MSSRIPSLFDDEQLSEPAGENGDSTEMMNEENRPEAHAEPSGKDAPKKVPQPLKADKNYYTIGEVAAHFAVNTSHIRFWTKEFDLKVRTTRKGDRLYTPEQVKQISTIYHLVKERGFTIAGAKAKIKADKKAEIPSSDFRESLLQLRKRLILLRNKLT